MTIEVLIDNAITKGTQIAYEWADKFIIQSEQGENLGCCELKLLLLNVWMQILEEYKFLNFGGNGSITPVFTCTSLEDVNKIISKINQLEC